MERDHAELEGQARHNEHQTKNQHGRIRRIGDQRVRDLRNAQRTRGTVDHGHAIEQQTRRQGAEDEILHGRFGRSHAVAVHGHQCVNRQRQQFNTQVNGQQVVRRDHDHHAESSKQHQHIKLATTQIRTLQHIRPRVEHRDHDSQIKHQLEEIAHQVINVQAIKSVNHFTRTGEQGQNRCANQGQLRQYKGRCMTGIFNEKVQDENQTAHGQNQNFWAGCNEIEHVGVHIDWFRYWSLLIAT